MLQINWNIEWKSLIVYHLNGKGACVATSVQQAVVKETRAQQAIMERLSLSVSDERIASIEKTVAANSRIMGKINDNTSCDSKESTGIQRHSPWAVGAANGGLNINQAERRTTWTATKVSAVNTSPVGLVASSFKLNARLDVSDPREASPFRWSTDGRRQLWTARTKRPAKMAA